MPTYPTDSGNSGLGVESSLTQNNVTRRRELKNNTATTTGKYPSDGGTGMTVLSNSTQTYEDLALVFDKLQDEIAVETESFTATASTVNDGAATTASFITNLSSAVTDFYVGYQIVITSGALAGTTRPVTAYNGTTKAITVAPVLGSAPANAVSFALIKRSATAASGYDAAVASMTSTEKSYAVNLFGNQFNTIQGQAEALVEAINMLNADLAKLNTDGTLGTSRYPSGQNRGY